MARKASRARLAPDTAAVARLKKLIAEHSQEWVAEQMAVSQQTVSLYARRRARPANEFRARAELLLGIPVDDWYSAEERKIANGERLTATG